MAKVLLSGIIDSITGRLGGSVFQVSNGGLMIRRWVKVRNPATFRQQRSRTSLSSITKRWPTLSPADIATWVNPSGGVDPDIDFFSKINQLAFYGAQAEINTFTGDIIEPVLQPAVGILTEDEFTFTAAGPFTVLPADTYLNIYATRQLRGGTQFINDTTYLHLTTRDPSTDLSASQDIWPSYVEVFGPPRDGTVIGLALKAINIVTGSFTDAGRVITRVPAVP